MQCDFVKLNQLKCRVATHLENLEKSGNSKVLREKSGKMEKVRETEICLLDFERAEELKLQLLAACGPGARFSKKS